MKPNPGSDEAIKLGCSCSQMDNAHGRRNDGLFWINADCPVHGVATCSVCGHELEAVPPWLELTAALIRIADCLERIEKKMDAE